MENNHIEHPAHKHYNQIDFEIWSYRDGSTYGLVYRKRLKGRTIYTTISEDIDIFKGDWDSVWNYACKLRDIEQNKKQNIRRNVKITDNFTDASDKRFKLGRYMSVYFDVYFVDNGASDKRFATKTEAEWYLMDCEKTSNRERDISFHDYSKYDTIY